MEQKIKHDCVNNTKKVTGVPATHPDVVVMQGDISEEAADMLVSPDDTQLSMSGGASAALRDAGGEELYETAQAEAPIDVGEVAVTPAFELFADYVVHVASKPALGSATAASVQNATETAFQAADEHGCRSIVLPPLGGGVGGLDGARSAELICATAAEQRFDSLAEIRLITRSSEQYRDLCDIVVGYRSESSYR